MRSQVAMPRSKFDAAGWGEGRFKSFKALKRFNRCAPLRREPARPDPIRNLNFEIRNKSKVFRKISPSGRNDNPRVCPSAAFKPSDRLDVFNGLNDLNGLNVLNRSLDFLLQRLQRA